MRRIGFAYNPTNDLAAELAERLTAWCRARGVATYAHEAGDLDRLVAALPETDLLAVIGGDGTFLRAAQAVARVDVPILGLNCGKVGFLSKAEDEEGEGVLTRVLEGRWRIEERLVLRATLLPGGREQSARSWHALNEAAVVRGAQARVVRLEVSVGGTHMATYIADGLVVSSPTGSTGYSFSAGGPILDPGSRNLVVTPVAAYLSAIRSIVVGPQHTVEVRVEEAHGCLVSIDGHIDIPLVRGDVVRVAADERPMRFLEPEGSLPFWELLRRKVALLPS